jgi:VIT1/CCC1 family predicted Fe2+/Mn2+ transporter
MSSDERNLFDLVDSPSIRTAGSLTISPPETTQELAHRLEAQASDRAHQKWVESWKLVAQTLAMFLGGLFLAGMAAFGPEKMQATAMAAVASLVTGALAYLAGRRHS